MKTPAVTRVAKLIAWILASAAFVLFLRTWLAPDACLDFGGSFNYEMWECNRDVNEYISVGFYELKSFWLFLVAFILACVLQWSCRNAVHQTVTADRLKTGSG